jgi:hypothetical protein
MAKKPAKTKQETKQVVQPQNEPSFDVSGDDRQVVFNLTLKGQEAGKIESSVCLLHRLMLRSQHEAMTVRENEDYIPYYAKNLSDQFGVFVSEPAAYRIACIVADLFVEQKKS